MENTKNNNSALNPELKATAEKLFKLLEEERENNSTISVDMSDEMENALQANGADDLYWAILMARTASQNACWSLEESTYYMDDETLETIHELAKRAKEVSECLGEDRINVSDLNLQLESLNKLYPQVLQKTSWEFQHRCMMYGKEIKQLS